MKLGWKEITDVSPLAGLTNLTELELEGNKLPRVEMSMIREALPNCKISP